VVVTTVVVAVTLVDRLGQSTAPVILLHREYL